MSQCFPEWYEHIDGNVKVEFDLSKLCNIGQSERGYCINTSTQASKTA